MLTLQERANLQLSLIDLKNKYQLKFNNFQNSNEYKNAGFFERMELVDEFNNSVYILKNEINSIENELNDFLEQANNQDDENCLNCGS